MRILVGEKLSQHKYKTPEGYLVCTDAILARTGKQTYLRNEVFNDGSEEEVEIDRTPEEVFSDKTITSFENKPITIEHPNEEVNVDNYKEYAVGFVRDVRRDVVDGNEVLKGNLIITDKEAIDLIERGEMNELSCGYDCDILDEENPQQRNIRGNHLALCKHGRAGIARIVDSINVDSINEELHKYKIEYETYVEDWKTREADIEHHISIQYGKNAYDAALKIKDKDIEIIRVYKDDKLLHSFSPAHQGRNFGRGKIENLKGLDSVEDSPLDKVFENDDIVISKDLLNGKKIIYSLWIKNRGHLAPTTSYFNSIEEAKNKAKNYYGKTIDCVEDSIKDDALEDFFDLLDDNNIDYDFISGGYGIEFRNNYSYTKAKELAKKVRLIKGVWDDRKLTYHNFSSTSIGQDSINDDIALTSKQWISINKAANNSSYTVQEINNAIQKLHQQKPFLNIDECVEKVLNNIKNGNYLLDSINDVEPRSGESKEDFIKRFMSETVNEYPDEKQRYAVALKYWKGKDSMKDTIKDAEFTLNKNEKLNYKGHTLYRVYYGSTKGGWVESEKNIYGSGKVLDEAKVYGNAKIINYAKISEQAEVYGNAKIADYAKISGQAEVYGNAIVYMHSEVLDKAKVYGYANIALESVIKNNAEVCGNASIVKSEVYGNVVVNENAEVDGTKVYGNAQIYGNAKVRNSMIFGNAIVKDDARVDTAEIQGTTVIKGNMEVKKLKISSNKDLENAGIKDSIKDSINDAYIDLDFDGDENDARKLANRYGCQYKRNGSANGYPIFRFTGPRDKLQKLCKTYGMDKKDFDYYVEDSIHDEKYIYLYAKSDITPQDKIMMRRYGLEILGTNRFGGEVNLAVKGDLSTLKKFNKEYMAYEMHPDYLYKEHQFGGEITRDSENENENDKNKLKDILKIAKIAEKFIK